MNKQILLLALALLALMAGASAPVRADSNNLTWSGEVDDKLEIVIRGRSLYYRNVTGNRPRDIDYDFDDSLPAREVNVRLDRRSGRGSIDLIERPNRNNGYSAVVRIHDPQAGSSRYSFTLRWDNNSGSGNWGGNGGNNGNWGGNGGSGGNWGGGNNNGGDWSGGGGWDNSVGRRTIRWTGRVDGTNDIRIQRDDVQWRKVDGRGAWDVRYQVGEPLPYQQINVRIDKRRGRGSVYVLTQPGRQNNYTLTIRVVDKDPGDDYYDFSVRW
jgi:hypothetical protein